MSKNGCRILPFSCEGPLRSEPFVTSGSPPACTLCPTRARHSESKRCSDHHHRYFAKNASNRLKALDNLKNRNVVKTPEPNHLVDYNSPLTVRECEILLLSAKGLTNRDMSKTLSISRHTVKRHFDNIFNKLGVNNRTMAVAWAVRHGLV